MTLRGSDKRRSARLRRTRRRVRKRHADNTRRRPAEIPIGDPSFVERFLSYVDPTTGEWTGYRDEDGYGIFTCAGPAGERVKFRAHRVAWAIANHSQPTGVIRHGCDHPPCCRPQCLSDGTQAENIADRDDPRRGTARRTAALAAAGRQLLPFGEVR